MNAMEITAKAEPLPEEGTAEEKRTGPTDRLLTSERILTKIITGIVVIAILFFALRSAPVLLSLNIRTAQAHAATLSKVSGDGTAVTDHKYFLYRIYASR